MGQTESCIKRLSVVVLATAFMSTLPHVATARTISQEFSLKPGEQSRDWVFSTLDHEEDQVEGVVPRSSEPDEMLILELEISQHCHNTWNLVVREQFGLEGPNMVPVHVGTRYRKIISSNTGTTVQQGENYEFQVSFGLQDSPVEFDEDDPSRVACVLGVRLFRQRNQCSMSALVTGDINGSYFGDVAYFNQFEERAASNFMDPGQVAMLDQLIGGMTVTPDPEGPMADEETGETEETMIVQPWSFADEINQWAAEDDEDLPAGIDDTFHISLVEILSGSRTAGDGPNMRTVVGANSEASPESYESLINMEAALEALGAFSLTATSSSGDISTWMTEEKPTGPRIMPLTIVRMKPGGFVDGNLEGIKFIGTNGNPGQADIMFKIASPNVLTGLLEAELLSEREYRLPGETGSRRLKIRVLANFIALRGAYSCLRD